MDAIRCFVFGALYLLCVSVFAQEVLVERAPEYSPGEDSAFTFTSNRILGPTTINVLVGKLNEKNEIYQMRFDLKIDYAHFFSTEGVAWVQNDLRKIHLKLGKAEYEVTSTIVFPLGEGDTFDNVISKSKPCRGDVLKMCLESTKREVCDEVHLVSQGVSFTCKSDTKQVRYIVDRDFKWLIHFEKLDPSDPK